MARFWPVWFAGVLALGLIVFMPATALAADEAKEKPDILSPRFDLTIWTIVVFVLLLLILRKYAWGPVLEGLQNRENRIRKALEDAEIARKESADMRARFDSEIRRAQEEAREVVAEAHRAAQRTAEEMLAKAKTEIGAERDRLRREIETAKDQALKELWEQTARLATNVASKAVRRQLTIDDHRRLVDEALAEMRQAATPSAN